MSRSCKKTSRTHKIHLKKRRLFHSTFPVLWDSQTTPSNSVLKQAAGLPLSMTVCTRAPTCYKTQPNCWCYSHQNVCPIGWHCPCIYVRSTARDNDVNKEIVTYQCNTFGNVSSLFALAITLHKHLSRYESDIAEYTKEKLALTTCLPE